MLVIFCQPVVVGWDQSFFTDFTTGTWLQGDDQAPMTIAVSNISTDPTTNTTTAHVDVVCVPPCPCCKWRNASGTIVETPAASVDPSVFVHSFDLLIFPRCCLEARLLVSQILEYVDFAGLGVVLCCVVLGRSIFRRPPNWELGDPLPQNGAGTVLKIKAFGPDGFETDETGDVSVGTDGKLFIGWHKTNPEAHQWADWVHNTTAGF